MLFLKFESLSKEHLLRCLNVFISSVQFDSFSLGVSSPDLELKEKVRGFCLEFLFGIGKKLAEKNFDVYFLVDLRFGLISCSPSSVFIFGRYNKYSRVIAQTFHYCFKCKGKGCSNCNWSGKLSEHSIQEILEKVFLSAFKASYSFFHGCGREDVDVRMLGNGRPFVLELKEPLVRHVDLNDLCLQANSVFPSAVKFSSFRFSSKDEVIKLKSFEFEKVYSCVCVSQQKFSEERLASVVNKSLQVFQRTPLRVSKRRSDLVRCKSVFISKFSKIDDFCFSLELRASHGLYIKEFVSGDGGRTSPSISSILGLNCVCKELDVLAVLGVD